MLQWGDDKFMHFMSGAAGYAITESLIVLFILAFGKELYDHIDHQGWDNNDALATWLGGVSAWFGIEAWNVLPYTECLIQESINNGYRDIK